MTDSCLLDTNVLLRFVKPDDFDHRAVHHALLALRAADVQLLYTSQNLAEFWNVCTRPVRSNGFGLSTGETQTRTLLIEAEFRLLPENHASVHAVWRRLVVERGVSGVQVHDARIAAAMMDAGVQSLLTFNTEDFKRYPAVTALHPAIVAAGRTG